MKTNFIYKGDCSKALKNQTKFPSESVNLIITSPPYSNRRKHTYGGVHPREYVEWFLPISAQLHRILKTDGSFILNIKEGAHNGERETYVLELILALKEQGWCWVEEYCWHKKNAYPGKWPNRFRDSWERCLHFTKGKKFAMYQDEVMVPVGDWAKTRFRSMKKNDFIRHVSGTNKRVGKRVANWLDRKMVYPDNVIDCQEHYPSEKEYPTNILKLATECGNKSHSAVFPIELPTWFIKLFTKSGDIILDPFMGIGTTAQAALLLNRRYLGVEIQQEFVSASRSKLRAIEKDILLPN